MSYEQQDASLRVIGIAAALLASGVATSIGISAWWYHARFHDANAIPTKIRQTSFTHGAEAEPDIAHDWRDVDAAARARLETYGWVDRDAGVAHIPIERAMELVARGAKPVPGPKEPGQVP